MMGFPDLKKDKELEELKAKSGDKIEIDVSSAQKLISNLSYSAKELSDSVAKVEKNRDLSRILDELADLKSGDLKNFNKNLSQNLKRIETSVLQKMSSYASVFESDDIQKTLDEIEKIERFTKRFKFKSIVFSVLLSLFVGIFSSYFIFQLKDKIEIKNIKTKLEKKYGRIATIFANVDFKIGENRKIYQLMIRGKGVSVFSDKDGKYINIEKRR